MQHCACHPTLEQGCLTITLHPSLLLVHLLVPPTVCCNLKPQPVPHRSLRFSVPPVPMPCGKRKTRQAGMWPRSPLIDPWRAGSTSMIGTRLVGGQCHSGDEKRSKLSLESMRSCSGVRFAGCDCLGFHERHVPEIESPVTVLTVLSTCVAAALY